MVMPGFLRTCNEDYTIPASMKLLPLHTATSCWCKFGPTNAPLATIGINHGTMPYPGQYSSEYPDHPAVVSRSHLSVRDDGDLVNVAVLGEHIPQVARLGVEAQTEHAQAAGGSRVVLRYHGYSNGHAAGTKTHTPLATPETQYLNRKLNMRS